MNEPDDNETSAPTDETEGAEEAPEVSSVGTVEAASGAEDEGDLEALEPVLAGEDTEERPGLEKAPPYVLGLGPLKSALESLIFVSDKPLTDRQLAELAHASVPEVRMAAHELMQEYDGRGIELHLVAGGYQFRSAGKNAAFVRKLVAPKPVRLSRALLETLSIVAYRQPVTKPEIDDVRGVDSGEALRALAERELVRVLGRKEDVGRPLLYGTSKHFLEFFGLNSLRDLPTLREYAELNDESRALFERRMGEPLDLKSVQAQADAALADAHSRMLDSEPAEADDSPNDEPVDEGGPDTEIQRDDDEPRDEDLPRDSSEDEE